MKGPAIFANSPLPLSPKGSILVDGNLRVKELQSVFAIGDNAFVIHPKTKTPLPWVVPVAEAEARYVASHIIREIKGKSLYPFRPWEKYPFVITAGKKYAIADRIFFQSWGILGWVIKIAVELRYLLSILPAKKAFRLWRKHVTLYQANDQ